MYTTCMHLNSQPHPFFFAPESGGAQRSESTSLLSLSCDRFGAGKRAGSTSRKIDGFDDKPTKIFGVPLNIGFPDATACGRLPRCYRLWQASQMLLLVAGFRFFAFSMIVDEENSIKPHKMPQNIAKTSILV